MSVPVEQRTQCPADARQIHLNGLKVSLLRITHAGGVLSAALWILLVLSVAGAVGYTWHYLEAKPAEGDFGIQLSNVTLATQSSQLVLQADARVRLPPTVQAGLDSGVPLTFVLRLKLIQPKPIWFDNTVLDVQRHYTLTYYELTRHYRVSALENDVSRNFRSLSSALTGLGEMAAITADLDPQQRQALLEAQTKEALLGSLVMRLSKSALPLPLQPIIRSSWTMVSEEYRWPLT